MYHNKRLLCWTIPNNLLPALCGEQRQQWRRAFDVPLAFTDTCRRYRLVATCSMPYICRAADNAGAPVCRTATLCFFCRLGSVQVSADLYHTVLFLPCCCQHYAALPLTRDSRVFILPTLLSICALTTPFYHPRTYYRWTLADARILPTITVCLTCSLLSSSQNGHARANNCIIWDVFWRCLPATTARRAPHTPHYVVTAACLTTPLPPGS